MDEVLGCVQGPWLFPRSLVVTEVFVLHSVISAYQNTIWNVTRKKRVKMDRVFLGKSSPAGPRKTLFIHPLFLRIYRYDLHTI